MKALLVVSKGDAAAGQDMPELGLNWLYDLQMLGLRRQTQTSHNGRMRKRTSNVERADNRKKACYPVAGQK